MANSQRPGVSGGRQRIHLGHYALARGNGPQVLSFVCAAVPIATLVSWTRPKHVEYRQSVYRQRNTTRIICSARSITSAGYQNRGTYSFKKRGNSVQNQTKTPKFDQRLRKLGKMSSGTSQSIFLRRIPSVTYGQSTICRSHGEVYVA